MGRPTKAEAAKKAAKKINVKKEVAPDEQQPADEPLEITPAEEETIERPPQDIDPADVSPQQPANDVANQFNSPEDNTAFLSEMGIKADEKAPDADINPMKGDVDARGPHAEIKTDPNIPEVPEYRPKFTPPPVDQAAEPGAAQPAAPSPVNPALNNLTPDQQRQAAESAVDGIFGIWEYLKAAAGAKAAINIDKVKELHSLMKIDMNIVIEQTPEGAITFMSMVENFNIESGKKFTVSVDFKNRVREPMIREFIKRKIGLTDMQMIAVGWGIEMLMTGVNFASVNMLGNKIIDKQEKLHQQMLNAGRQTQQPPPAAAPTPEQKAAPVPPSEKEYKEPEEKK
jgi:hypothetical protein